MRKKMEQRMNKDNLLEIMPYISEQPWYVENWYDEDIVNAMDKAGICVNEVNFKKAKNAVVDVFDNKEDRNDLLKGCVEAAFSNEYVKTDDLQYQKALSDTEFSMMGAAELPNDNGYILYRAIIDVSDYEDEKESTISSYYGSVRAFEETYEDCALNGLFAELIFEQILWAEELGTMRVPNEDKAEEIFQQWIREDS